MKKFFFALVAVVTVVWGIWTAFPVSAMETIIEDSVRNQNVAMTVEGLRKGLFYRLYADRIALTSTGTELISLHAVHAKINPLNLIALRIDLSVHGRLGEGSFSGDASLSKKSSTMNMDFRQARLRDVQFLTMTGIRGEGTVSGNIILTDQRWHVDFFVGDAAFEPTVHGSVLVPLNFFHTVKGAVDVDGNTIDIASIYLEGKDIFARLKGVIRGNLMDLRVEVMPEKLLLENPLFISQVERYQVSPGYYVIPVKGPIVF